MYAIELNGFRIVQAKAVLNKDVASEDMKVIRIWRDAEFL